LEYGTNILLGFLQELLPIISLEFQRCHVCFGYPPPPGNGLAGQKKILKSLNFDEKPL
jgi:hypothetical protein